MSFGAGAFSSFCEKPPQISSASVCSRRSPKRSRCGGGSRRHSSFKALNSSSVSEYVAATHTAKEALWLRKLFSELFKPIDGPTTLYSDNQSAIALTKDSQYHARTKHIDIRFHFIRLVCQKGCVRLLYCPTAEMTADILTKALPSLKVKHFASALGLRAA